MPVQIIFVLYRMYGRSRLTVDSLRRGLLYKFQVGTGIDETINMSDSGFVLGRERKKERKKDRIYPSVSDRNLEVA